MIVIKSIGFVLNIVNICSHLRFSTIFDLHFTFLSPHLLNCTAHDRWYRHSGIQREIVEANRGRGFARTDTFRDDNRREHSYSVGRRRRCNARRRGEGCKTGKRT